MIKAASTRDLYHKTTNNNHNDKTKHENKKQSQVPTTSSSNAHSKALEKCLLKVHGIGESPFLMELVPYDTIKTVRSLLGNVLKNEFIKQNSLPTAVSIKESSSSTNSEFKLFTGFPRRMLCDDSKSLGDLGLVPNGVLHLVRARAAYNG